MQFGIGFGQDLRVGDVAAYARAAEEAGFEHATFIDMSNLGTEVHVTMAVATAGSERIRIGHGVTDPIMYHPAIIAAAVGTIRELCGERVFVGIGAGGPYGKPYLRSAKIAELLEAVRFIKAYSAG